MASDFVVPPTKAPVMLPARVGQIHRCLELLQSIFPVKARGLVAPGSFIGHPGHKPDTFPRLINKDACKVPLRLKAEAIGRLCPGWGCYPIYKVDRMDTYNESY